MQSPGNNRIRLRGSARTSRGRVRQNNEDKVQLWIDDVSLLAVVADGMGGAVAGEEASRIAVETIQNELVINAYRLDAFEALDEYGLLERLAGSVKQANLNIIHRAQIKPELKGMGTTLTLAFARHHSVLFAHVGDSRAYLIDGHDGQIVQITTDHSFVQALVDAGHITPEEAEDHTMKNVLYRALGQSADVDIDTIDDIHLSVGDRLVLCSDGLTLHVKAFEIAEIALDYQDPDEISEQLIQLANNRGGRDNISVIVIVAEAAESFPMPYQDDMHAQYGDDATVPMSPIFLKPDPDVHKPHHPDRTKVISDGQGYGEGRDTESLL